MQSLKCNKVGIFGKFVRSRWSILSQSRKDSPAYSEFMRESFNSNTVDAKGIMQPSSLSKSGGNCNWKNKDVMKPIETEQGVFEQVLTGELDFSSDPWPSISDSATDLVRKMLVRDWKKRLTAHEVLCHPWVQVEGAAPDKPLDSAVLSRMKQFSAMSKFKKMDLRVIAESLSEEEIVGLKEMFMMIDTDNSGQITYEELKNGLNRVGADLKESEIYALMEPVLVMLVT